jgi:hypothetical protein
VYLTTANQTITVEFVEDAATAMTKAEFWIEVLQSNSTPPLGTVSSTRDEAGANAFGLGTAAAADNSTETWTGSVITGMTNENESKCSVTVAGGAAGVHSVWVNIAPSSAKTVYVCPHVDVT